MRSIFKQSSWLIAAQGLTRVIGFFYTIFLARSLGIEGFGIVATALAYFSIFSIIADFGFNRYLIKEISLDHKSAPRLLFTVTMIRLALTSVLFAAVAVFIYQYDNDSLRKAVVLLALLAVLPQSISFSLDSTLVAMRKLQYSSIGLIILSVFNALIGFWLVNSDFGPIGAAVAIISGQLIYLFCLILILRSLKIGVKFVEELDGAIGILKETIPFGILGILGLLYFRIDTLLLSYLRGNYDTGIYTAGYKFLEAVVIIPSAFASALFPVLTKLHGVNTLEIKRLYFKSLRLMLVISLFVVIGYIFVLPAIIKIFLPNYLGTIEVLKILTWTIPFMFIHIPGATVLMSTNKYIKEVLILSILTLTFNILANLYFIPQYGYLAAAWITVISEMVSFIIFFLLLKIKVFK